MKSVYLIVAVGVLLIIAVGIGNIQARIDENIIVEHGTLHVYDSAEEDHKMYTDVFLQLYNKSSRPYEFYIEVSPMSTDSGPNTDCIPTSYRSPLITIGPLEKKMVEYGFDYQCDDDTKCGGLLETDDLIYKIEEAK